MYYLQSWTFELIMFWSKNGVSNIPQLLKSNVFISIGKLKGYLRLQLFWKKYRILDAVYRLFMSVCLEMIFFQVWIKLYKIMTKYQIAPSNTYWCCWISLSGLPNILLVIDAHLEKYLIEIKIILNGCWNNLVLVIFELG